MRRSIIGMAALLIAGGMACEETLSGDPEIATIMFLFPGNDTVFVDVGSGSITSGPILIFGDAEFRAEFFGPEGTPDSRVTETRFRLDVTPQNTGVVTFTRATQFSGTLHKVMTGSTEITFSLYNIENAIVDLMYTVPIDVN